MIELSVPGRAERWQASSVIDPLERAAQGYELSLSTVRMQE
jgi:hypothetical protein